MDCTDLLAREEVFKKLNNELQKKSVSLMKQIDSEMQKQDIFNEFLPKLSLDYKEKVTFKHSCSPKSSTPQRTPPKTPAKKNRPQAQSVQHSELPRSLDSERTPLEHENSWRSPCRCSSQSNRDYNQNDELEFLQAFVSVNVQTKILPQSFLKDKVTTETVCKYLSNKIKLLQEQIEKLQSTLDRKATQCEQHLTAIAEHECERLKLLNKSNQSSADAADMRAKCALLTEKLNTKDRLYKEQRSDADKLSSEVKRLKSKMATSEARAASYEEEVFRLRSQVEAMKNAEKELRSSTRALTQSHTSAISRLESKVKSLASSIETQNSLISNLRQQNDLLTVGNAVKGLEKEYVEFLTQV